MFPPAPAGLPPAPRLPELSELPDAPTPAPDCPECKGLGVLVEGGARFATGRLCGCVGGCRRCGGDGQVVARQGDLEVAGRCRCRRLPDAVELWNAAGISGSSADCSFSTFRQNHPGQTFALTSCIRWLRASQRRGLVLFGPCGTGKTHLMVALLRELVFREKRRVAFWEFSDLLAELRAGYERKDAQRAVMEPLLQVEVLAIDELGKGRGSDWEEDVISQVVNAVHQDSGKVLLATTNYPPGLAGVSSGNLSLGELPSLADRVGPRVSSRLAQLVDFVEVTGPDERQRALRVARPHRV